MLELVCGGVGGVDGGVGGVDGVGVAMLLLR